jgi:hypothetical protein
MLTVSSTGAPAMGCNESQTTGSFTVIQFNLDHPFMAFAKAAYSSVLRFSE